MDLALQNRVPVQAMVNHMHFLGQWVYSAKSHASVPILEYRNIDRQGFDASDSNLKHWIQEDTIHHHAWPP